jgi:hypothetical protein
MNVVTGSNMVLEDNTDPVGIFKWGVELIQEEQQLPFSPLNHIFMNN